MLSIHLKIHVGETDLVVKELDKLTLKKDKQKKILTFYGKSRIILCLQILITCRCLSNRSAFHVYSITGTRLFGIIIYNDIATYLYTVDLTE